MSEQRNSGQRRNNNNRNRNNNNRSGSRNNNNRNRSNSQPRHRAPRPLKLTGLQKFLKLIGLFNEEKARKKQDAAYKAKKAGSSTRSTSSSSSTPARSNTRVAKERKPHQPVAVETARLYVGNLSYDATDHDIEELFKGIGSVKKVEIIYNRHTHKSRGYGFVQMLNTEEAKRAVEVLHDQPFLGRNLIVNGSKARKESDRSGDNEEISDDNAE